MLYSLHFSSVFIFIWIICIILKSCEGIEIRLGFLQKKITLDNYIIKVLKLIFPEFLIKHFNLVNNTNNAGFKFFYFEKRNFVPIIEVLRILVEIGFHKEVTIQDIPLRGIW